MTLALVGNITLDQVHVVNNLLVGGSNTTQYSYMQVGAIGNILRVIKSLDVMVVSSVGDDINGQYIRNQISRYSNVKFDFLPTNKSTTTATIVSDISTNTRTSIVHWGACSKTKYQETINANWCHILYGDKIWYDIDFIKKQSDKSVLSMDLCSSQHNSQISDLILKTLPYLDFLIISDQEYPALNVSSLLDLGQQLKGWAIIHSPKGSKMTDGKDILEVNYDTIDDLDVLGAGDTFASHFIQNMTYGLSIKNSIYSSHNATTKYLRSRIEYN